MVRRFVSWLVVTIFFIYLFAYLSVYLIIGLYCLCQVAVAEVTVLVVASSSLCSRLIL